MRGNQNLQNKPSVQTVIADVVTLSHRVNANLIYNGTAMVGEGSEADAIWQIRRITTFINNPVAGQTTTKTEYANGSTDYNQIWANRLTLSYSI
jgi:hypothetical protein